MNYKLIRVRIKYFVFLKEVFVVCIVMLFIIGKIFMMEYIFLDFFFLKWIVDIVFYLLL